ncbi:MAG: MotA/TolQ/ExbB proton channel family protein [candidate division Zixibacteria bacterium]|nr:MotA/TolQ/ExbB proton channel family protein [candidate division Zixibacteria bacterium]
MFNKWKLFKKVEEQNTIFLNHFRRTRKFSDLTGQAKTLKLAPLSGLFVVGYNEIKELMSRKSEGNISSDKPIPLNNEDIIIVEMALERATAEEIGKLEKYVVFLATTANAAPFLGLLGTVVGVMDAFWSIGERGSASLAVVAPGIAQALLATIVGLGAAIPAVIGFNWAGNKLKYLNDKAVNFSLEFSARARKELT